MHMQTLMQSGFECVGCLFYHNDMVGQVDSEGFLCRFLQKETIRECEQLERHWVSLRDLDIMNPFQNFKSALAKLSAWVLTSWSSDELDRPQSKILFNSCYLLWTQSILDWSNWRTDRPGANRVYAQHPTHQPLDKTVSVLVILSHVSRKRGSKEP